MFTLLARMHANGFQPKGIACEEYTAVCIDETGIGHVYGFYPTEDDYAYFLFANCNGINNPETLTAGLPLTWIYNQSAVYAYKVSGDNFGTNTFNLNTWQAGTGTGSWEFWYVDNAVFNTVSTTAPSCSPLSVNDIDLNLFNIFPNPITNELNINIQNMSANSTIEIYDEVGRIIFSSNISKYSNSISINTQALISGIYFIKINGVVKKIIKY